MSEPGSGDVGCAAGRQPSGRAGTALVAGTTAVLAGLALVSVFGAQRGDPQPHLLLLDLVVAVLGTAAVPPLLTRWPVRMAVLLAVLAAISPAATPPATLGTLQVASQRPVRVATVVALAGTAAHALRALWRHPLPGLSYGWWLVLVVVAHAALLGWGTFAQARQALVASLRERAARLESERDRAVAEARRAERTRIAREMHDVLAHRLSLLATYAGALEFRPDAAPEQRARAAGVLRAAAHQALEELREVIGLLRDDSPTGGGPDGSARPQPTLADLPTLVAESRAAGVSVDFVSAIADPGAVPPGAGRAAYRIVQEGLTNARKHAHGQPVRVAVSGTAGDDLVVDIRNPVGADRHRPPMAPGSGTGLIGLGERVQLAGGRVEHGETAGEFLLRAALPWPA